MVTVEWMREEILKVVPDATVEATDLHGSGDHFHVRVISEGYEGVLLSLIHISEPTRPY